ncbi:E3 ubiquitin-protein ligase RNF10-like [Antedon mediterranea]|uniref:E3 ubiquitin-protein ligase RNF10-like n=1 Tax=Antedon mediterranea TaxID=105859 RepID=UPI003AF9E8FC
MLEEEEVEMEVKSSSRLLSSGGNARCSQLDKAKDNIRATGNGSPRYNKRRDPPLQKGEVTNSARSRPLPKFRGLDKRPRGRNTTGSGRRDEVTHAQRAEYGSALQHGPKKVNLNHLINFTFAPRDSYGDGSGSGGALHGRGKWNKRRPRYNKEQFLQANCQFVVRANHDYAVHSADADILVDWDLIERVCIFSHEETCCPICLYPPTVAKMTRCGHVYCWSCILHYLSLGERSWRKCPICDEGIVEKDLKSVIAVATQSYPVGEQVTMRLMKREKGSVVAVPVSHELHKSNDPFKLGDDVTKACFVKLLTTTNLQILDEIIRPEKEMLQFQLSTCEDDFERTFIEAAIKLHQEREDALLSQMEDFVEKSDDNLAEDQHFDISTSAEESFASVNLDEDETKQFKSPSLSPQPPDNTDKQVKKVECSMGQSPDSVNDIKKDGSWREDGNRRRRQSSETEHTYYFYQAADSQHLYVHSLNARCLVSEYGSLSECPETISGQVIEIEHLTMTQELRKRYRYLKHLPLTCEFRVCELKLKPPLVSKETIKAFSDEFQRKKRARDKKVREEKKRSQKIELEEGRRQGKYPSPRMSMQSHRHFPDFAQEDEVQVSSPTLSIESASPQDESHAVFDTESSGNCDKELGNVENSYHVAVPSFAQMLRTASAKPQEAWPNLSQNPKPTLAAAAPVWHRSAAPPLGPDGSDDENEDYIPVPTYKDSFSNAIQDALDKAAMKGQTEKLDERLASPEGSPGGKKGKKGKKKQKQLLFSTAGQRFK